ncbi:MAG: TIGR04283 family arsenosugar biosynthesis glycosyltransferase [Thermodesulfobacteriota bacterium]|nr:TIGR04283 family arsenosugar biosynthesis glycosyltransferase [Thermodesulfobacteriota bacterium]
MRLSIIMPVLNEAPAIAQTLLALQPLREAGHEVIVVDGGSHHDTITVATPYADKIIQGPRGRSHQMNTGAKLASGEILLFLHGDTFLPGRADRLIIEGMNRKGSGWGRFDVILSGKHPLFRIIEILMNWRSRLSSIATGDQAIFVKRELFEAIGGFPEIDLMEDIALSKILKKYGRPLCLYQRVLTSSRRWEKKGLFRTIFLMWFLRVAYFFKVNPKRLAKLYYPKIEWHE